MRSFVRVSAVALALVATAPFAAAQTTVERRTVVELTPEQRTVIRRHVVQRSVTLPPAVQLRVGTPLPPAVELYAFPEEVYVEVPALRRYRYVYVDNDVVLVDPATSEIVEIIRE